MPIDSTRSIAEVVALIRQAVANSGAIKVQFSGKAPAAKAAYKSQARKPQHLAKTIAQRVAALDSNDAGYPRRVLRILVESALLDEFGEKLINAPHFQNIVELVVTQMESSPLMTQDIATVVGHLKASASASPNRAR